MLKKFTRYPSKKILESEAKRICKGFGIDPPEIRLTEQVIFQTNETHVLLLDPGKALAHDPSLELTINYWEYFYHELGHWIAWKLGNSDIDHRPTTFMVIIAIGMEEGLPPEDMFRLERMYKPGALKRATKATGKIMRELLTAARFDRESQSKESNPSITEVPRTGWVDDLAS